MEKGSLATAAGSAERAHVPETLLTRPPGASPGQPHGTRAGEKEEPVQGKPRGPSAARGHGGQPTPLLLDTFEEPMAAKCSCQMFSRFDGNDKTSEQRNLKNSQQGKHQHTRPQHDRRAAASTGSRPRPRAQRGQHNGLLVTPHASQEATCRGDQCAWGRAANMTPATLPKQRLLSQTSHQKHENQRKADEGTSEPGTSRCTENP